MNDYERLMTVLRTTAALKPEMPLSEAVDAIIEADRQVAAAGAPGARVVRSLRDLADLAKATPSVAGYMDTASPSKIHAIKELRRVVAEEMPAETHEDWGGLKAAKDAIEMAWPVPTFRY